MFYTLSTLLKRSGYKTPNNKTPNITKRPMLQNAQLQNAQCYKTPNYKTPNATKRPMLQNAQSNKTPNVKKRPMLQKVHILCKKTLSVEVLRIITDSRNVVQRKQIKQLSCLITVQICTIYAGPAVQKINKKTINFVKIVFCIVIQTHYTCSFFR